MALRSVLDEIRMDPFTATLFGLENGHWSITEYAPGFVIGPLNVDQTLRDIILDSYPKVYISPGCSYPASFFVDDSPQAVVDRLKDILTDADGDYFVTITHIRKDDQESEGGWRWHKWGPYVGARDPQCEYLYDEPDIDGVVVAHIYQTMSRT